MKSKKNWINWLYVPLMLTGSFLVGCGGGVPFKYSPSHAGTYPAIANKGGAEILKGRDVRDKESRKGIPWKESVESIVADAVADELRHAKLFLHVEVSKSEAPSCSTCSHAIKFNVRRLRLYNQVSAGEVAGGAALGLLMVPGIFIAASIPTKWESSAEIEFEVLDPRSKATVFRKVYSETRVIEVNAYAGLEPKLQQTSDVLEAVVKEFVSDLAQLPLSTQAVSAKGPSI